MPRLRITTGLSLLALVIGVAGTAWLSPLGAGWAGPVPRLVKLAPHRSVQRSVTAPERVWHGPVSVVQRHRTGPEATPAVDPSLLPAPPPALVPLTTSADRSEPWYKLRGHLDGRVRVHLDIDGHGHVSAARIASSSGDPVLDAQALRSVQRWTFAVPAGYPHGFNGDLPMRFSSQPDALARAP